MEDKHVITCDNCKKELFDTEKACPECGGELKTLHLSFNDTVRVYERLRFKLIEGTGKRKVKVDSIQGHEQSHNGEIVYKERVIDSRKDEYFEKITNSKGEVIREVSEKLTEHQGHGNAKFDKTIKHGINSKKLTIKIDDLARQFDVAAVIKLYMPSFLDLLGSQPIKWAAINKAVQKNSVEMRTKILEKGELKFDATFHTILFRKHLGPSDADGTFDFFNTLFKGLNDVLTERERRPIHRMLKNVLDNLDTKYLNFIGELAVLLKYVSSGLYELIDIEVPISTHGKETADLLLKDKSTGQELLIEVYNLRLETRTFTEFKDLKDHLDLKLTEKAQAKIRNPDRQFFIQPVIWYKNHEQLKFVSDFFNQEDYTFQHVNTPAAWACFKLPDAIFEQRFESIKTILLEPRAS